MIMNNIKRLAKELAILYETMYQLAESSVNYIIDNKITDSKIIEKCLDDILNIPTDKGWLLLQRLTTYYISINKEIALSYIETYCEMYDLDQKIKKRTK